MPNFVGRNPVASLTTITRKRLHIYPATISLSGVYVMDQDWVFYFAWIKEQPASIFLNIGLFPETPDLTLMTSCRVQIEMNHPRDDGLSSSEEFESLSALEDHIAETVTKAGEVKFVGRVTHGGQRHLYYYAAMNADFDARLQSAMTRFPDYRYRTQCKPDPEWDVYRNFLYPSDREMQSVQNLKVLGALRDRGDTLQSPREIDHRVYFNTTANAQTYSRFLRSNGFGAIEIFPVDARIAVDFSRIDLPSEIDDIVYTLYDKAVELHGQYDGWGCEVQLAN
ncbi:DUF695 domain-containing protein [Hoeflea sp. WL0058]|uniref:DUF695 domain-containing protein n=1 Tax=Flavimaribacter sediminis TaxID=2865987 RepID=A0AAE2ZKM4_9HYPH|nr:DUF695 domain-containing protein [Flavimaribacter sediminis]MBW8638283.1 DUF695 domain-containing protein [Flavimaribacter sediminis]